MQFPKNTKQWRISSSSTLFFSLVLFFFLLLFYLVCLKKRSFLCFKLIFSPSVCKQRFLTEFKQRVNQWNELKMFWFLPLALKLRNKNLFYPVNYVMILSFVLYEIVCFDLIHIVSFVYMMIFILAIFKFYFISD